MNAPFPDYVRRPIDGFVTDTHRAVSQFPDLYDSLEHQQWLTDQAEKRRRSNAMWATVFMVTVGVAAVLIAYVAILEVAR